MNNHLKFAAFVAGLVASVLLFSDGLVYSVPLLMGTLVLGALRLARPTAMKLTRWAKKYPGKSQGLIAFIELFLMVLGLMAGYNLRMMDVEIPNTAACLFSAVLALGFLTVQFRPKRGIFLLPKEVEFQRLSFTGIALSSLMLMTFAGNRMHDYYPDSPIAWALEKADHTIFPTAEPLYDGIADIEQSGLPAAVASLEVAGRESVNFDLSSSKKELKKAAKKLEKEEKKAVRKSKNETRKTFRTALAAGSCTAAVFLIFLLVIATCAGLCLLVGGIAAIASGEIGLGVLGIVTGPIIVYFSVKGIKKVSKWCKKDQPVNAK